MLVEVGFIVWVKKRVMARRDSTKPQPWALIAQSLGIRCP